MKASPVVHGTTEFVSDNVPALKRKLNSLFLELEQVHSTCNKLQRALEHNHKAMQGLAEVGMVEKTIIKAVLADSKSAVPNMISANSGQSAKDLQGPLPSAKAKSMQKIISSLNSENMALLECVKDLVKEKTVAQSKGLLLEELVDLTESEYKAIMQALAKDRTELRFDRASLTSHHPSVLYTPAASVKPNSGPGQDLRYASQYSQSAKVGHVKKPGMAYSNVHNQLIDHHEEGNIPGKLSIVGGGVT